MTTPTSHAAWAELVQAALVGTERAAADAWRALPPNEPVAPFVARAASADQEASLLAAAALLGVYVAAAGLPAHVTTQTTAAAPTDASDLPVVPAGAERHLWTMLAGTHAEALPDWLGHAASRRWRAPALALPPLLALATRHSTLRVTLPRALGARGRWLAARNPEWAWAAGSDPLPDLESVRTRWETGAPDERRRLLEQMRAANAAQGRALLESTWAAEPPAQRTALLGCLRERLGPDDEPFLESALDDRRQEVRRAAAGLLALLPESALVRRMAARAMPALRYDAGGILRRARLDVVPPAAHDSAMGRDGVEITAPAGVGERAWWLAQILAAVPPQTWRDAWRASADTVVRLAADGEWARPLLDGWAAAAVRHRDAEWAEAVLRSASPGPHPTPLAPSPVQLLAVLAPERQEALVADLLRDRASDAALLDLVLAVSSAWSERFARLVLAWVRRRTVTSSAPHAADWRLRESLPQLALRIPVTLTSNATSGWALDSTATPAGLATDAWARPVERFVALLTFRQELLEGFDR